MHCFFCMTSENLSQGTNILQGSFCKVINFKLMNPTHWCWPGNPQLSSFFLIVHAFMFVLLKPFMIDLHPMWMAKKTVLREKCSKTHTGGNNREREGFPCTMSMLSMTIIQCSHSGEIDQPPKQILSFKLACNDSNMQDLRKGDNLVWRILTL